MSIKWKSKRISTLALAFAIATSVSYSSVIGGENQKNINQEIRENRLIENESFDIKNKKAAIDLTNVNMRDFVYLIMDSNEHYHYSDLFIKDYQQASGGYIAFAKKTGHIVDKTNYEPNQKWHFFESWLYQSFNDGSLTWDDGARSRVYTRLLCPELLLWIYEACGVDSTLVDNAYDVAVQGKIDGITTTTIAKNMRAEVSWDDLVVGLAKKTYNPIEQPIGESTSGITVGDFANFLIDKNEQYTSTSDFIKNYQPVGGEYIDFANKTGHKIDKDNGEPNQKWHFFEYWLLNSLKNGHFAWEDNAELNIYNRIESSELLLWIYEACEVSSSKVALAKTIAENGKNTSEDPIVTAGKMKECVSWSEVSAVMSKDAVSVTLLPNPLELMVGEDQKITATVTPSNTDNVPTWSVIEGEENITITPNGNSVTIHGVNIGSAKVQVSYSDSVSDVCSITIKEVELAINGLPNEINLDINESLTLSPSLNVGEGTFTYSSSAENIVSVTSDGVVTALAYGESIISVQSVENPQLVATINAKVIEVIEGAETLYSSCLFGPDYNSKGVNNYTSEFSATNNGFTWNLANFSNYNNRWSYVRVGNANEPSIGTITTNSTYEVPISKVILTIDSIRVQDINSISLLYGSSLDNLSSSVAIDSLTAGDHTFIIPNPITNQYYRLAFDCKTFSGSSNRIAQVSKIDFYKIEASTSGSLEELITLMNNLDTCLDYDSAPQIRELYNALSVEDQEKFNNTICKENEECTMKDKLAYMEYLNSLSNNTNPLSLIKSDNKVSTNKASLVLILAIALFTVSTYYYLSKKKHRNGNN